MGIMNADIMLGFFGRIGTSEIIVILVVALVLFGGSQLPKLARRLGRGLHEFQEGVKGAKDEFEKGLSEDDKPKDDKLSDAKPADNGSKGDSPKA